MSRKVKSIGWLLVTAGLIAWFVSYAKVPGSYWERTERHLLAVNVDDLGLDLEFDTSRVYGQRWQFIFMDNVGRWDSYDVQATVPFEEICARIDRLVDASVASNPELVRRAEFFYPEQQDGSDYARCTGSWWVFDEGDDFISVSVTLQTSEISTRKFNLSVAAERRWRQTLPPYITPA